MSFNQEKYKKATNVRSAILEEKGKLSSPFEYLLILVPKEYLKNFKEVTEEYSNIEVMRCYA
jgi:hypothetical protein